MFHKEAPDEVVLIADIIEQQESRIFQPAGSNDKDPRRYRKRFAFKRCSCDLANCLINIIPFYFSDISIQNGGDIICLINFFSVSGTKPCWWAVLIEPGNEPAIHKRQCWLISFLRPIVCVVIKWPKLTC